MESILKETIPLDDLKNFERQFVQERRKGKVKDSTQFSYAWALTRSQYKDDIHKGIGLLENLCTTNKGTDQRDYLFYIAVAYYRLEEYSKALPYVQRILSTEPNNQQAQELERIIKRKIHREGLMGLAVVGGGVAVAAAAAVGALIALARK
ncbi:mitochondrial fission 1 protein-like [Oscarella lobularis]|uniref:mitochondrial fission 1 protein-like n=1 Tax=Oscarella lobularis TaxID=121494 RepID=UPI003313319D